MDIVFNESFGNGLAGALQQPVVGLQLDLQVGDLGRLTGESTDFWQMKAQLEGTETATELAQTVQQGIGQLQAAIDRGDAIRVWWSDHPDDRLGFMWLCALMKDVSNQLTQVKVPLERATSGAPIVFQQLVSLGEWDGNAALVFLSTATDVPASERLALSEEWTQQVAENAPLRVTVNGHTLGVPVDFWDKLIAAEIRPNKSVIWTIGRVLGELPVGLPDWWVRGRLAVLRQS
ncbi:DUF1835 domain-containing protein [Levilactobacillus tongjiangensis]|uniref:DUF1835 domain-containing protein n=2 Tax=Levilactobacillus tongjiangensis TaxID=2486023 RepID=A0ABW1SRP2_9LACO|nr:DUF1835 domain-containing protein [Levilactobacillus tongjiangensis]